MEPRRPRVVIVGAGFGGLAAAKALKRAPVEVVVVDRENYHLFQPLVYQVAMAAARPGPTSRRRSAPSSRGSRTRACCSARSRAIDLDRRHDRDAGRRRSSYDYLVVAGGTRSNYFGNDDVGAASPRAPRGSRPRSRSASGSSSRSRRPRPSRTTRPCAGGCWSSSSSAEGPRASSSREPSPSCRGAVCARDFRRIDPASARVHIVEGDKDLLSAFPEDLRRSATRQLEELGVIVHRGLRVTALDPNGVTLSNGERLDAATIIWAAGVKPVALAEMLPGSSDAPRAASPCRTTCRSPVIRRSSASATWPTSNRTATRSPV